MHLIYYDEVKYHPPNQESYWLGGICVPHTSIPEIENQVNEIAYDAFGSRVLEKSTELHGIELCRGTGNFKGRDFDERLDLLTRLLEVIGRVEVMKIIVEIIPENISYSSQPYDKIAFMYFVEKAESLLAQHNSLGMMFGDYDEPAIGKSVASLSRYRRGGTNWAQGCDIDHLIDTVHFAKSHHSRLIQLADIFLYCYQFRRQANTAPWREKIQEIINNSEAMGTQRHKRWPIDGNWYR